MAQRPSRRGCASGGWPTPTRQRPRPRAIGSSIDVSAVRIVSAAARAPTRADRLRFIAPDDGNADDRTVLEVPLDTPVAPGRHASTSRSRGRRTCRAPFARTGVDRQLLLHRAVVSEDRRARGRRLELPSVPLRDRVLRRLRHLRRPADRAGGLDRRRHRRRARAPTTSRRHRRRTITTRRTSTTSRGRRARDFVERRARFEHPDAAAGRDAAAAAARARGTGRAPLRRRRARRCATTASGSAPYPYGHITIVDPGLAERRRRHGISDALHRRHALAGAARGDATRRASRFTKPATSSGTASSPPTSSSTRGWTRGSTPSRPRGSSSSSSDRNYVRRAVLRRVRPVGCFATLPLTPRRRRRSAGRRIAPTPGSDVQSTPTWRYWPGTAGAITYNKTALWLHTLERMLGWPTLQRILSTYFAALGVQASEAAGFLRRRQRGQRPGSDLVLRPGLPQLADVRLRRRLRSAASASAHGGITRSWSARRIRRRRLPGHGSR